MPVPFYCFSCFDVDLKKTTVVLCGVFKKLTRACFSQIALETILFLTVYSCDCILDNMHNMSKLRRKSQQKFPHACNVIEIIKEYSGHSGKNRGTN